MRWLWSWFFRRPVAADEKHVTLYTRTGCHLCDDAQRLLAEQQRLYAFALDIVDIDVDSTLREQYGNQVPVVVIDGKERFHGHVNRALLARLLRR